MSGMMQGCIALIPYHQLNYLLGNVFSEIPPHLRVHCSLNCMSTHSVASFTDRFE